jgi:hypothetical protein
MYRRVPSTFHQDRDCTPIELEDKNSTLTSQNYIGVSDIEDTTKAACTTDCAFSDIR